MPFGHRPPWLIRTAIPRWSSGSVVAALERGDDLGRSHVTDDELRRIDEQLLHIERRRAKRTAMLGPAPARIPHTKAKVAP